MACWRTQPDGDNGRSSQESDGDGLGEMDEGSDEGFYPADETTLANDEEKQCVSLLANGYRCLLGEYLRDQ